MSLFLTLAQLGEQLSATKKKLAHSALIAAYWQTLAPDEIAIASRLLIGRIFPESDARTVNLSSAALQRVLEKVVGAPIEWSDSAVDFGDAVQKWLDARGWQPHGAPLEIQEVYRAYKAIAETSGTGSRARKDDLLAALFQRASALEAKYIVKQISGEMRVGVDEGALLDALTRHTKIPAASVRRANQMAGDVGAVIQIALTQGEKGLAKIGLGIGRPLKPMLAQSADSVSNALEILPPPLAFEYKFDGVRLQIH